MMKIFLMIRGHLTFKNQRRLWRFYVQLASALILSLAFVYAAKPPKQLANVIQHFMDMDSTSLEISQVIDWRFSGKNDSIKLQMNIKAGHNFHMILAVYGMEIFVTDHEMVTINHSRQQILYENASPDALLKQLFVGGDLNTARFKREQDLEQGLRRLEFQFSGDFSDWESLAVIVDQNDDLKNIILQDYDGNKYLISLKYLPIYEGFLFPDIESDFSHYQIADLRD